MKKVIHVSEQTKSLHSNRLSRNVSDQIVQVDNLVSKAQTCRYLFTNEAISVRGQLKEACEKALNSGSVLVNSRVEEILWRKVFYETYNTAKQLRKDVVWMGEEIVLISNHLHEGLSFYHHYLMNLAEKNPEVFQHSVDFIHPHISDEDNVSERSESKDSSYVDSVIRCLTCLGDISRYMIELSDFSKASILSAIRFYLQALNYNNEIGLTNSNLAAVYGIQKNFLPAALHYLRALNCNKPFIGAELNLKKLTEKSSRWVLENSSNCEKRDLNFQTVKFLHSTLALVGSFFKKNMDLEPHSLAMDCQEILVQLGTLLDDYDNYEENFDQSEAVNENSPQSVTGIENSDESVTSSEKFDQSGNNKTGLLKGANGCIDYSKISATFIDTMNVCDVPKTFVLNDKILSQLCALFFMCAERLKNKDNSLSSTCEVLIVAIFLTVVTNVNSRLEQHFTLIDPNYALNLFPSEESEETRENEEKAYEKQEKSREKLVKSREKQDKFCEKEQKCNGLEKNKKSKLSNLRRRKKLNSEGSDSDLSDFESNAIANEEENDSDTSNDFGSLSACSSDNDLSSDDEEIKIESETWNGMSFQEHFDVLKKEQMLGVVTLLLKWLLKNEQLLKICSESAHNLWESVAKLMNLLKVDFDCLKTEENQETEAIRSKIRKLWTTQAFNGEMNDFSLPEFKMFKIFLPDLKNFGDDENLEDDDFNTWSRLLWLNYMTISLCKNKNVPLRFDGKYFVCRLMSNENNKSKNNNKKELKTNGTPTKYVTTPFHALSSKSKDPYPKTRNGVKIDFKSKNSEKSYARFHAGLLKEENSAKIASLEDANSKIKGPPPSFFGLSTAQSSGTEDPIPSGLSSMQNLTAQWLNHEVKSLELKTGHRKPKLSGLYIVPDTSVLVYHLPVLQKMVAQPTHLIIIPQTVIDCLDQQKRTSGAARDAIRWLENKLRNGSRFVRTQRPHEKAHISLVKYPKKKDKEAWEWFHVAECCCYLSSQVGKTRNNKAAVTLLTTKPSDKVPRCSFSLRTLAEAAECVVDSVENFVSKWHSSSKGSVG